MRLKAYDERDGRKVWLGRDELDLFLSQVSKTEKRIALHLAARCGLRVNEVVNVTPLDVVEDDVVGPRVRVKHGKGDTYREVPATRELKTLVDTYSDIRDDSPDTPLVDRATRTVNRWVGRAADACRDETSEEGWRYLGPHDLRRTWGTLLVEDGVEPGMIMEWGGWQDWETFREHYLGAYSPEMERYQASKVSWLGYNQEESGSETASPGVGPSRTPFRMHNSRNPG
jgi:integrase